MRREASIGILVFALALVALLVVRSDSALHPPYPRSEATRAALRDAGVKSFLERNAWTRARVIALDKSDWRVTFNDGPRTVLDAAVDPRGRVVATEMHSPSSHPLGSSVPWTPALLVLMAALFIAAVAGWPLRSARNRDALVVGAGFSAAMLLIDARLVGMHVYVAAATLAYLVLRCSAVGLGAVRVEGTTALYERALTRMDASRVFTLTCAVALVAGVVLTITSTNPTDVAIANLAGATLLNHGQVPYGHLPGFVVHGDTYPLLSYVLYMPAAAIAPVRDVFDSFDGALWSNAVALTLAAFGMARLGGRTHFLAWLAFPPVVLAASAGSNDVPAACFVIAALLTFARPLASSGLLVLAGWVKIVPAAALVVWIARLRTRGALQALLLALGITTAGLVAIAAIGGSGAISDAIDALRFQTVRGSWFSLWQQLGLRSLQPLFQAATLGFAAALAVRAHRTRPGLRQSAALAAAIIALLQISANYWSFVYLVWLLPFVLVALFPAERRRSRPLAPSAP